MEFRTIVVAADIQLRNYYQQQVRKLGVECASVASLRELFGVLQKTAYNGLLIDLATLIKADRTEKSLFHELLQPYPLLRLKWDHENNQLRCLLYGTASNAGMSIKTFIDDHCRPFKGRRIRKEKRLPLHYNTLISKDNKFRRDEVERSTTLDISPGGCSLLTTQQREISTIVWLRIMELADQTPIRARVCSCTHWGTPMKIPTIGVCFESLTESQLDQITHPSKINLPQAGVVF